MTEILRNGATLTLLTLALIASQPERSFARSGNMLSFEDRVAYQYAIEGVYWRHRIWPKDNATFKPPLDAVLSREQVEKKVEDYLRKAQALEDYWQRPITAEQLQAEMDRIAKHTQQPEVLRELFEALGNDPFVVAECLARPALVERLLSNWYARDERVHGELRQRAEADLRAHGTIQQMKHTCGNYSEMELVRSDKGPAEDDRGAGRNLTLSSRDWDQLLQKLDNMFKNDAEAARPGAAAPAKASSLAQLRTGVLTPLQEDATRYYATAVIEKTENRLRLATMAWPKEPLESWLARVENQTRPPTLAMTTVYALPNVGSDTGSDNTWRNMDTGPPGRIWHTAVWTGSEMIVWGGAIGGADVASGWRYNPSTDTWVPTTMVNSPNARRVHTAVWTGSEMIIWGGVYSTTSTVYLNAGARYNPSTDSWVLLTTNLPSPRAGHTALWSGSEMIIWGGYGGSDLNTGGRYNPNTNLWTATDTVNAPSARESHTAVWSGSEMIIWGGFSDLAGDLNTGGRYNPNTNLWTATRTINAPSARDSHTAVWSGSEMVVWGGSFDLTNYLNTGGRYNPATNSWSPTSIMNAATARSEHTATWTGSEMIVWGGDGATPYLNTGGRYNPNSDSWTATTTTNAPVGRDDHTAVWTGNEMIVWGGFSWPQGQLNTGGRYNPASDSWIATAGSPKQRDTHTAVWTGSEMIVWGGIDNFQAFQDTGGSYNPTLDSWLVTSMTNAPRARTNHSAVWTGREMIVWGGSDNAGNVLDTGGRYNPSLDSWTNTSASNAAKARRNQLAVWTGSEMIVWGGISGTSINTGGKYNPDTDSWTATSVTNAPPSRSGAVWTGREMIVWGSFTSNTGGRYNPATDSWTLISTANAPVTRTGHAMVWTGNEMIVWGGFIASTPAYNTGGRYNPDTDTWTSTSLINVPSARLRPSGVWTGTELVVWGGVDLGVFFDTGGRYNPVTDSWVATTTTNAPTGRDHFTGVWTGNRMIVWGGTNDMDTDYNTGGIYSAQPSTPLVQSAVSRKMHGNAGSFDVNLPVSGTPGIECRSGGATSDYTIVVTFLANVSINASPQAAVSSGIGAIGSGGVGNGGMVMTSGNVVTFPLTNVGNAQTINVTLNNVNGSTNVTIPMRVLIGDTNGDGFVNSGDAQQTRNRSGQTTDATNFRSDVNADGFINSGDTTAVRARSGTALP